MEALTSAGEGTWTSWKSVGMNGLGFGRCSAGSVAASHAASQSAGTLSQLYCVEYMGSRSITCPCRSYGDTVCGPIADGVHICHIPNPSPLRNLMGHIGLKSGFASKAELHSPPGRRYYM